MDIFDSHSRARAVKLPLIELNNAQLRVFRRIDRLIEIESYPGDIHLYCKEHADRLKKIELSPPTPTPTPTPTSTTSSEEVLLIKV